MTEHKKNPIRREEECDKEACGRNPEGIIKTEDSSRFLCSAHYRKALIDWSDPGVVEARLLPTEVSEA